MSDNDKITLTLKADGGAPWIVVHAETGEEAHRILDGVIGGAQSIAEHTALAADVLSRVWAEQKGQQPVAVAQQVVGQSVYQAQQAAAPAAPTGPPPTCVHGERVHREGRSAKGPWEAYFCPTEKGTPGQCAPLFKDKKTGVFA
jgi:hypothetical protein